jgi:hypothetical protein
MHADAPPAQRQRDAASADSKLKRRTRSGDIGEETDSGVNDRRIE